MICYKCQKYVEKSAEKCPYCGADFKFSEKLIQQAIEGRNFTTAHTVMCILQYWQLRKIMILLWMYCRILISQHFRN